MMVTTLRRQAFERVPEPSGEWIVARRTPPATTSKTQEGGPKMATRVLRRAWDDDIRGEGQEAHKGGVRLETVPASTTKPFGSCRLHMSRELSCMRSKKRSNPFVRHVVDFGDGDSQSTRTAPAQVGGGSGAKSGSGRAFATQRSTTTSPMP